MADSSDTSGEITELKPSHEQHVLQQILEEDTGDGPSSALSPPLTPSSPPLTPSSPPATHSTTFDHEDGKYVCKLQRKKSSIRRKRVLTAFTSDNKPVHIPLVEYGDRHDMYDLIAQRVMHGADVTHGIRLLREKLGVLTAIRDACTTRVQVQRSRDDRIRRRVKMKRVLVTWTSGWIFMCFVVVVLKILYIMAKAYYRLIEDHIHHFRA